MQYLQEWRGRDKRRKRAAEEGDQESSRKRTKEEDTSINDGRRDSIGIGTGTGTGTGTDVATDQEFKIRGSAVTPSDDLLHASSPLHHSPATSPATEPSSIIIHPDRRANILNAAPDSAPLPDKNYNPHSSLSRSPEHIVDEEPDEQRPKPLHSTSHPNLRLDTIRSLSSLDPSSPDRLPLMTSSSKATPPPTNSDLGSRRNSIPQPQLPLLDGLNDFARFITSAASLSVRHALSKQQAAGQQKERDRQSKFKYSFLTLIEDAESRAEGAEKVSMGIEKQLDLSSQAQSKTAMTLAAQLQKAGVSDGLPSAHDRGRCKEDIVDLKAEVRAVRKKIDYLNTEAIMRDQLHKKVRGLATKDELRGLATRDELRGLGTKAELRGLVTKDELRRVATDEVRKHVAEALLPTENKLASLTVEDANLSQKIKDLEVVAQNRCVTIEEQVQQQLSRLSRLETSLNDMQMRLSRLDLTVQAQQQDYATQQDVEKLDKLVRQTQDHQAASESSHPVFDPSIAVDTGIQEDVKVMQREVDALKSEQEDFKLIRHDLDVLKGDQEKVSLIRADLDSLINEEKLKDLGVAEGFEAVEKSLNKQLEDLARLQQDVRLVKQYQVSQTVPTHPLTPPFASASTSPCLSDHQKLRDVEIALKDLTKTTQGLELFVNHQQQKFDGLTSERVVQSMIHQMQQMYPQHPGNLFDQATQIFGKQAKIDNYLSSNLKDRLLHIDSQIAARVDKDSKFEEAIRSATETQTCLLSIINSLKLDMDGLKAAVHNERLQDSSDYGEKIDELVVRMTAVEARYVKAIGDFHINQTNLAKQFNQLRYQNGIEAMRSTLEELTGGGRSSKSVEPNGITVSSENCNDSDRSDTPLSLGSPHGVRGDSEERPLTSLKRKVQDSDDEDEDEQGETRSINAKKIAKRRNVSGMNPFS